MDMENESKARLSIRNYIQENMVSLDEDIDISDSDNIFEKGFVSSIFAMRLLNFIEKEFSVEVMDEDIILSNFCSVDNMIHLVKRLKGASYGQ